MTVWGQLFSGRKEVMPSEAEQVSTRTCPAQPRRAVAGDHRAEQTSDGSLKLDFLDKFLEDLSR
jgi:hypothetical protein